MIFHLENPEKGNLIKSYEKGQIMVNEQTFTTSIVVGTDRILSDWPPNKVSDLTPDHFETLLEFKPEIIIFGSGEKQQFPSPELMAPLIKKGIGLESMNTAAACRTYNVLVSEYRRVVAALLLE
ncbi:MAG: Mth938-like domain-containing protein [Gammaproteobacteria bacterium]|nr:Mth938-like domain-containing protein [Gammaproteobacteria bacterium]MDH5593376.1 Mth938-like domain-containing protein [Gammaproteobacteria bacterium]MDH5613695.1 Mth938-like domain-containing protein [Gammaproteobacteria bacterium]